MFSGIHVPCLGSSFLASRVVQAPVGVIYWGVIVGIILG